MLTVLDFGLGTVCGGDHAAVRVHLDIGDLAAQKGQVETVVGECSRDRGELARLGDPRPIARLIPLVDDEDKGPPELTPWIQAESRSRYFIQPG